MTRITQPIRYTREQLLSFNTGTRPMNPVIPGLTQAPNVATIFNNRVGSCKPIDKCTKDQDDFNPPAPQMGY